MRFIESIQFKDGSYINLPLHQDRVNSVFSVYSSNELAHNLVKILPDLNMQGTYKVRLVYDMDSEDATYDLEFVEYHPRKIETLEVIQSKPFDYSMKYEDRTRIDKLIKQSSADDIIITFDNYVTDGSYFNLAFWDGSGWFTPDTPLLNGVRRTQLLVGQKIKEAPIRVADLGAFEKVSLINAMLDLGELELPISAIKTQSSPKANL